eukprot:GHVS01098118.1.p1 GENE.GHVS01098118.1~~GHVS01098118.1.p1  ORF type:complete len:154 (+),score=24.30 GHVS01098118.1:114-575(+)
MMYLPLCIIFLMALMASIGEAGPLQEMIESGRAWAANEEKYQKAWADARKLTGVEKADLLEAIEATWAAMQRETEEREEAIVEEAANEAGHTFALREAHRNWTHRNALAVEATWAANEAKYQKAWAAAREEVAIEVPVAQTPDGSGEDQEDSP